MFNMRPDKPWFQFGDEPLEDLPGFRMNADGTIRDASPGDLRTAFLGIDPRDSAALPGGTMFNVQPGQNLPGLHNFRPPEEGVPGFRMNADGSIRDASTPSSRHHPDVGGNPFGRFDQFGTKPFTSVGDGSPPPYLAYDPGFSNGLGKVPTLDEGEPGGTSVSLPSNSPYFPERGAGERPFGSPPSSLPSDGADPSNGLRPPATSFIYAANPSPMPGSTFAGPIAGEGLSAVGQSDTAEPGVRPMPGGGADPNVVPVAGGEQTTTADEVQVAQAPTAGQPSPPAPSSQRPGRGYGTLPQRQIEQGMSKLQKQINRDQAFRELTRQPLTADEARYALSEDWETTKPADVVDDIKRAAERHGVPLQLLARLLYQEGKFGEVARGRAPLVMESSSQPIGYAQMTRTTFEDLIDRARRRGDTARAEELKKYSLANRAESFDAAAEQLAYLYRLLGGSWPKAVAGYNVGPTAIWSWFDAAEQDPNDKDGVRNDPRFFATRTTDKYGKPLPESQLKQTDKWKEMSAYLRMVLRGAAEDPATSDMYDPQPPRQYRARKPIPPQRPPR